MNTGPLRPEHVIVGTPRAGVFCNRRPENWKINQKFLHTYHLTISMQEGTEEFYTNRGLRVYLGQGKHRVEGMSAQTPNPTLLYHQQAPSGEPHFSTSKGLKQTRFHTGFERRQEKNISNIFQQQEKEYMKTREAKAEILLKFRSERLQALDKSHGYNPITGIAYNPATETTLATSRSSMRRVANNGMTDQAMKKADINMRNSADRFYLSGSSQPNSELRQKVMLTGGLQHEKTTWSLSVDERGAPSFGVEDQFSKSLYTR